MLKKQNSAFTTSFISEVGTKLENNDYCLCGTGAVYADGASWRKELWRAQRKNVWRQKACWWVSISKKAADTTGAAELIVKGDEAFDKEKKS